MSHAERDSVRAHLREDCPLGKVGRGEKSVRKRDRRASAVKNLVSKLEMDQKNSVLQINNTRNCEW